MSDIVNVDDTINIIISQTNYTSEEAEMKYNEWNGDYMAVIKEYLINLSIDLLGYTLIIEILNIYKAEKEI